MQIENLFPTPVMRVANFVDDSLINPLLARIESQPQVANTQTNLLTHTKPLSAEALKDHKELLDRLQPLLRDFGFLLFGENLTWSVKEMWMNVSSTGGHQLIHSHANSFISAVIYLTDVHESARTIFHRPMGGADYVFTNKHADSATTPYNADRWVPNELNKGDLLLFPSYLLHAVPPNQGGQRVTIAMNALPNRLRSWDYEVNFSST